MASRSSKIGRWDWFMWVKLKTNQNWVFANRNGWWRRWWRWWWMIVMYLDLWEFGPHSIRKLFGHRPYLHMNNHNVVNPKKAIIVTIPTFTRKCLLPDLRTVEVYGIGWRKAIRQSIDFPQMISLSYPYHIPIIPLAGKQRSLWHPGPIRSYLVYAINPFRNVVMILLQTIWPRMKLGSVFFSGMDYGKMAAKEITKLVFKTRMSLRFMVVIRSYKLYFMGFIWVYKPAYIWEPHLLVVEPRWGTFPGRFLRATSLEWCEDDANFRRNLGSYPGCHWIGLRENIQETMVFLPWNMGVSCIFFP